MTNNKKSYSVTIFGMAYTLVSDEPEDLVRKSAQLVDSYTEEIAQNVKATCKDTRQIVVLAALRLAERLALLENQIVNCQQREARLIERIDQFAQNIKM